MQNGFEKKWNFLFNDNNNFYLCLGATVKYKSTTQWSYEYGFVGLINNFAIHTSKLELWIINEYFSCMMTTVLRD